MGNYTDLIASSPVVVVELYADWCPHCQRMMPAVEEVKELIEGIASLYQLNIDHNRKIADALEITGTPTFIIYRDGKEAWRYDGEIKGTELLHEIKRAAV